MHPVYKGLTCEPSPQVPSPAQVSRTPHILTFRALIAFMMMTTSFMNTLLFFVAALVAVVSAAPALMRRDVFVPPILYPHAGTVWKVGHKHNVTWCVVISV